MNLRRIIFGVILSVVVLAANQARAHYLWLERDGNGPGKAYFGEYADDRREKAGGLLLKINKVFWNLAGTESNEALRRATSSATSPATPA